MKAKWLRAGAIWLAAVGVAVVPGAWLEWVRWGGVVAILAVAAYTLRDIAEAMDDAPEQPSAGGALAAELQIVFRSTNGRPVDPNAAKLFKTAVMQCVRSTDQVMELSPETYSVMLPNVSLEQAQGIGRRICEQAANLVVFASDGSSTQISALVGGVAFVSGFTPSGHRIAEENLARLKQQEELSILISAAA